MARKATADDTDPERDTAATTPGADDLPILFPELTVTLAGESISVREYGFMDGLRVRGLMSAFIAELDTMLTAAPLVEDILDMLGRHIDAAREAMAISAARDVAWVVALNPVEGQQLLYTWWTVCGPFFLDLAVRRQRERLVRIHGVKVLAPDGPMSSRSSSAPATAPPSSSADTPSGS